MESLAGQSRCISLAPSRSLASNSLVLTTANANPLEGKNHPGDHCENINSRVSTQKSKRKQTKHVNEAVGLATLKQPAESNATPKATSLAGGGIVVEG